MICFKIIFFVTALTYTWASFSSSSYVYPGSQARQTSADTSSKPPLHPPATSRVAQLKAFVATQQQSQATNHEAPTPTNQDMSAAIKKHKKDISDLGAFLIDKASKTDYLSTIHNASETDINKLFDALYECQKKLIYAASNTELDLRDQLTKSRDALTKKKRKIERLETKLAQQAKQVKLNQQEQQEAQIKFHSDDED